MNNLMNLIWIEWQKAIRSHIPQWTAIGSLLMPLGIAFLIFVSRNPEISKNLGLISAKANLLKYSATDWATYLGLAGQMVAAGGYFMFVIVVSWVFGREFTDGTLKDLLAVPIPRWTILLSKFVVSLFLSVLMTLVIAMISFVMGIMIDLPHGSADVILRGFILVVTTGLLVIPVVFPFALFASIGRGVLLPLGLSVLTLIMANVVAVAGWGDLFPWCVPGLFAQGNNMLPPVSYWIVVLTGFAGIAATYFWWMYADQSQ
jgi:ABC-2 type transport system permease protein